MKGDETIDSTRFRLGSNFLHHPPNKTKLLRVSLRLFPLFSFSFFIFFVLYIIHMKMAKELSLLQAGSKSHRGGGWREESLKGRLAGRGVSGEN